MIKTLPFLFLLIILFLAACGTGEDGSANNVVIGNRYEVQEIINKSSVQGFTNDGGQIRALTEEELASYGMNFSYTDANDVNFVGLVREFTDENTVLFGTGSFATPFEYSVSGNTITVIMPGEPANSEYTIVDENRLERETVTFRIPGPTGGTMGTDGADPYPSFLADSKAMLEDGQIFTFQTSTWVLINNN